MQRGKHNELFNSVSHMGFLTLPKRLFVTPPISVPLAVFHVPGIRSVSVICWADLKWPAARFCRKASGIRGAGCLPAPVKCLFTEHHLNRLPMKKFKTTLVGDCATRISMGKEAEKTRTPKWMTKCTFGLTAFPWGHSFSETLSCTKWGTWE